MNLHRTYRAGIGAALAASSLAAISIVLPTTAPASAASTTCAASSLPKTGKVDITFWESMSADNEKEILALVKSFNASQSKVVVTDVNQSQGYQQTWDEYKSDIGTGAEPNVVMLDQYITKGAVDSKSFVPVATCVAGTKYSTKPFTKKSIAAETVSGKLQGLPYSLSAPILIYNTLSFAAAKIKTAPTDFAQMQADAKLLKGTTVTAKGKSYKNTEGMTLPIDPWFLQVWEGMANQYLVNNQNGRQKQATSSAFNNPTGKTVFNDLQGLAKTGDLTTNPDTGALTTAYANLYAIGYGTSGMTIDSSATLGTVLADLPLFPNVKLGVAAMPKLTTSEAGGVEPGGNALFLPSYSNSSAAKLAASWEFIQYLTSANNMATWDVKTGYVPIRTDAASNKVMKAYWKKYPELKVAYTELSSGPVDNATEGPLLGEYYQVSLDLTNQEDALFATPYQSPDGVLSSAATVVNNDITSYNSSL